MADTPSAAPKERQNCVKCGQRKRAGTCKFHMCKPCCVATNTDCKPHGTAANARASKGPGRKPKAQQDAAATTAQMPAPAATPSQRPSPSVKKSAPKPKARPKKTPQQPRASAPAMVDLKEVYNSYQKELLETKLWRHHVLRQTDASDLRARDEALHRYKANTAMLAEIFDGRTATQVVESQASTSRLAAPKSSEPPDEAALTSVGEKLWRVRALRTFTGQVSQASSTEELQGAVGRVSDLLGPAAPGGVLQRAEANREETPALGKRPSRDPRLLEAIPVERQGPPEGAGGGKAVKMHRMFRKVELEEGQRAPPHTHTIRL